MGFLTHPHPARGADTEHFCLESAGARFGFGAGDASRDFRSGEAFLNCNLPLLWEPATSLFLSIRIDFSAGWLGRGDENASMASVGPTLVLRYKDIPISLEAGSSSTVMSAHDFGDLDLGDTFQFTTHAGLNWEITRHWRLGYRFQHTSNAGLANKNPGLNLHSFGVSYVF
ncbi:MAG TPA: acyloxyacyl hydrolase [Methylomirabilota bacterium]|nr:acyloxyacyl hydrolase [Methylomirabilota bacterium]